MWRLVYAQILLRGVFNVNVLVRKPKIVLPYGKAAHGRARNLDLQKKRKQLLSI